MKLAVFCGSASGDRPAYRDAAHAFGQLAARRGIGLVYGGGRVGLMGAVADGALAAGGDVTGVMPIALVEQEIAHTGLTRLDIVPDMHARKTRMAELASGFVTLPGGAGTLEEIFEQWTWAQLGIHQKPCGFLNVAGYFDPLLEMIEHAVSAGFLKRAYAEMLVCTPAPDTLLERFACYRPPAQKWRTQGAAGP
ncbi:TIGR00730 family Rossman fold protein [Gluconacetobacter sacchari]|uniref:Cytokinin riboside 5'-monophosphate phosphoribohydrolase n=2 Tax=Gluconacetobacter sacchari TaxID=92759 RepID=A0A7W4NM07_9PROT|nr:TIGR00730 family Rossman fold protein [Gluconacetobacter sacchari]MBB2160286.1 TIGR00730 family Rossman fold protein [Gluconacetobacter sacchari]GBQ27734.1 lysine decarboxylase [Gluconacetobacter sacchari DSM 12717]